MVVYLGNIIIYTACIACIFLLDINKKKEKKTLILSIVTAAVSVAAEVIFDFIMNILLYIFNDEPDLYSGGAVIWVIFTVAFTTATVFIISKIAGCVKESGLLLVISCVCLLASCYIEYIEYMEFASLTGELEEAAEFIQDETLAAKDQRLLATLQEVLNKIPAVGYVILLWTGSKTKKKK